MARRRLFLAVRRDRIVALFPMLFLASTPGCGRIGYEPLGFAGSDASADASDADAGPPLATCTLDASDDGTTGQVAGMDVCDATGPTMASDRLGADFHRAYVRFDVASGTCREGGVLPPGAAIADAHLTLTLAAACASGCQGNTNQELRLVTEPWNEASLAPGAPPMAAASVVGSFSVAGLAAGATVDASVLARTVQNLVDAPATNHGFQLEPANDGAKGLGWSFATRESGTPALLVIRYVVP